MNHCDACSYLRFGFWFLSRDGVEHQSTIRFGVEHQSAIRFGVEHQSTIRFGVEHPFPIRKLNRVFIFFFSLQKGFIGEVVGLQYFFYLGEIEIE